jgi:hypothetical protein
MRKLTYAIVGLVALVATSVAVAHGIGGMKSAKAVAATFTAATTAGSSSTQTCTTTDGKVIVQTDAQYTGAAAGDPDFTGPITLRTRSVVNTTDSVGFLTGQFSINVSAGANTSGSFAAVDDHGAVAGLAAGQASQPDTKLLANLSATFDPATGFTGGKLGGGTAGGSAVELGPNSCQAANVVAEKARARGAITALSTTSITVAGLTCAVATADSADVNAKFKVGDNVEIRCATVNGVTTLSRIKARDNNEDNNNNDNNDPHGDNGHNGHGGGGGGKHH